MIYPLEQNGHQIDFVPRIGECFDDEGLPIEAGSAITICAWHDVLKTLTQALIKAGYEVSHGVCRECALKMRMEIYEQNKVNKPTGRGNPDTADSTLPEKPWRAH